MGRLALAFVILWVGVELALMLPVVLLEKEKTLDLLGFLEFLFFLF